MRKKARPGPKSYKQNKRKPSATLGDTCCTDESSIATDSNVGSRSPPNNGIAQGFHTHTSKENATENENGLEYTNCSEIPNPSPRRCSTFRNTLQSLDRPPTNEQIGDTPKHLDYNDITGLSARNSRVKVAAAAAPTKSKASKDHSDGAKQKIPKKKKMESNLKYMGSVIQLQSNIYLIPHMPFARLVRELIYEVSDRNGINRITASALEGLQAAAEMYLAQCLADAYMLTLHRGCVTLTNKDLQLIQFLRNTI